VTRRRLSRSKRALFACVAVVLAFACLEGVLALAGVRYARTPHAMKQAFIEDYIDWQNHEIELQHFAPHPTRMWAPVPGVGEVNEDGLLGRRLPRARRPGVLRVLFLGDSCTNAGPASYPEKTVALLEAGGRRAEPLIAACGGYSTHQGLLLLREVLAWSPDVVVAYFGWNDHWVSPQPDDAFVPAGAVSRALAGTLGRLRTYQLLQRLIYPPGVGLLPHDPARLVEHARVPPARFVANVQAIDDLCRAHGAPVYWVAAPTAPHVVESDKRILIGHTDLVPAVHALYVGLLRQATAGRAGVRVLELPPFDRRTMLADGIHPTEAGHEEIARALAAAILRGDAGPLPPPDQRSQ
jgi:lysophospholipase L1-like esterase